MTLNRRKLIKNGVAFGAAVSSATIFSTLPILAGDGDIYDIKKLMTPDGPPDHFIGNPTAKVTIIEYASSTCPACASFHVNTYPKLKETYIDSGKVRFVVRPFIRDILDAVVFLLAYKAGESSTEGYYAILDAYLKVQPTWARAENPRQALLDIAKQNGFTEESFDAALTNKELFDGIERLREQASKEFDMHGTPSFYINGKMLVGNYSFEEMAKEIDSLLGE